MQTRPPQTVLITGAAKRIGAACVRMMHEAGCNIILHYHLSAIEADALALELNAIRPGSVCLLQADLTQSLEIERLAKAALVCWGGVDVLVNNASLFYPLSVEELSWDTWDHVMAGNLKSAFFLAKALVKSLRQRRGCVVNLVDIHAETGLPGYPAYSIAKAGVVAMTRCLAKEWAPDIRVNAVAPGAILWPEIDGDEVRQADVLQKIPMQRCGDVVDIAKTVRFLICDAAYMTGQVLTVDGGRSLSR